MTVELLEASNVKGDAEWSRRIKERDKECKSCGSHSGLQACHIVGRTCEKLRYSLLNGVTLCFKCHDKATNDVSSVEEQIMRYAMRRAFGFDFYDVLQAVKYDV